MPVNVAFALAHLEQLAVNIDVYPCPGPRSPFTTVRDGALSFKLRCGTTSEEVRARAAQLLKQSRRKTGTYTAPRPRSTGRTFCPSTLGAFNRDREYDNAAEYCRLFGRDAFGDKA